MRFRRHRCEVCGEIFERLGAMPNHYSADEYTCDACKARQAALVIPDVDTSGMPFNRIEVTTEFSDQRSSQAPNWVRKQ